MSKEIESWLGSPKTVEELSIQIVKLEMLRNSLDNRIDILEKEQNGLKTSIFIFRRKNYEVRSKRKEIKAEINKKKMQLNCLEKWIEWDELLHTEVICNRIPIGTNRILIEGESKAKHAPYPNERAQVRSALLEDLAEKQGASSASSNSTRSERTQARLLKDLNDQAEKSTNRVITKIDDLNSHTTDPDKEQTGERPDNEALK